MTAEDVVVVGDAVVPEGSALSEEVVVAEDVLQVEALVLYQVMEEQHFFTWRMGECRANLHKIHILTYTRSKCMVSR